MGKTEWARCLGTHIYWMGMKDLDLWNNSASYLVMDDIPWEFVPDKKAFFGAQRQITLTDKYKRKRTVAWGKPLIFLCNYDLRLKLDNDEAKWYNDVCIFEELHKELY